MVFVQDGGTALSAASQYGHSKVVETLLKNGANIHDQLNVSISCMLLQALPVEYGSNYVQQKIRGQLLHGALIHLVPHRGVSLTGVALNLGLTQQVEGLSPLCLYLCPLQSCGTPMAGVSPRSTPQPAFCRAFLSIKRKKVTIHPQAYLNIIHCAIYNMNNYLQNYL